MACQPLGFLHTEGVSSLSFSPDGATLCSTALDGTVGLWDIGGSKYTQPSATLAGHSDAVNTSCFFADGVRLVTAGEDSQALVWDLRNVAEPCGSFSGVGAGVNRIVVSSDQALVYSASDDGAVVVHDVQSGRLVEKFMVSGSAINDMVLAPGILGGAVDVLCTATEDGAVRLWLGGSSEQVKAYREAHPRVIADEDLVDHDADNGEAMDPEDRRAMLQAAEDQMPRFLESVDEFEAAINHIHVRDDFLFASAANCLFGLKLDLASGNILREEAPVVYAEHADYVRGICTVSSGAMYSVGDDSNIVEWAPPANNAVRRIKAHDDMVMAVAVSPSETLLATGCEDSSIRLWQLPFATERR